MNKYRKMQLMEKYRTVKLFSDHLKLYGLTEFHIMGIGKTQEHIYTSPSQIVDGELLYSAVKM